MEHGLLTAMLSEVEAVVVDVEGIYLNMTLLIEDTQRPHAALWAQSRQQRSRYWSKKAIPRWTWWLGERWKQAATPTTPRSRPPKPYHSILAVPILLRDAAGLPSSLGAVSIDSEKEHHFDYLEQRIERKLLPYVTLLKLVLVYRQPYDAWPWRGSYRDLSQARVGDAK